MYRVFRINLFPLIPMIDQPMMLTCIMISLAEQSKGLRYVILKISFSSEPVTQFMLFALKHSICCRASKCGIKVNSEVVVVRKVWQSEFKKTKNYEKF